MRLKIFALVLLICLPIAGCGRGAAQPGVPPKEAVKPANEYRVTRVIDGDTVELANGARVRYIGIDTPEIRRRRGGRWHYSPEMYAIEAKEYNKGLVQGKKVKLEFDVDKEDKYGRWLAYVYVNGKMVNAELLRQGFATLYTYPPNVKHVDVLVRAQKEARRQKKGLWGAYETITTEEAGAHIGKLRAVRGRITGTYRSKEAVFLNFGRDFKVVIFNRNIGFFEKEGIFPSRYYKDKVVEVVGKIKDYKGPEIIVNHPWQVMVVGE